MSRILSATPYQRVQRERAAFSGEARLGDSQHCGRPHDSACRRATEVSARIVRNVRPMRRHRPVIGSAENHDQCQSNKNNARNDAETSGMDHLVAGGTHRECGFRSLRPRFTRFFTRTGLVLLKTNNMVTRSGGEQCFRAASELRAKYDDATTKWESSFQVGRATEKERID